MIEGTLIRLAVGFLLGATGIHAFCPIELSPPSVVVRYGDSVSVNCSASVLADDGLGWEASVGDTGLMENVSYVTWTVQNLTAWTIAPKCFINFAEDQCLKPLPVVVYKIPDSVTFTSNAMLGGRMNEMTEYDLICDVKELAPSANLTVTWYKGNDTKIGTSVFDDPRREPMSIQFNTTFTPSREDDGTRLRCELQMELGTEGPQHPFVSQEYPISVLFGPAVHCSHIEIPEGESLEGQCTVTGNPSPVVRWLKDGQPIDPMLPLRRNNTGWYTIEARGQIHTNKSVEVSVLYGPEIDCPDTLTVVEHSTNDLNCTVAGFPLPVITWYREGEEVPTPRSLTKSDAGQYTITTTNELSNVSHTVEIYVLYPPSEIVELEDTEVEVGSSVGLKCSSTGDPRPEYSWSYYNTTNVRVDNDDGVSLLHIDNATGNNNGNYTCSAANEYGRVSKTARVTVKGANAECPLKVTPERMVVQYGSRHVAVCKATSMAQPVEIYWELAQGTIKGNQWLVLRHQVWDPRPVCVAVFEGLGPCRKPLEFTMYRQPDKVFTYAVNHTGPMEEGAAYQLQCDIFNVAPVQNLTVIWYKGKETIRVENFTDDLKTPVNVSSVVNITLGRTDDGAEVRCEARLNLGPEGPLNSTISRLNITIYNKPIINATKLPKRIPVFKGYPEELVCEAEGYPLPQIQWLYHTDRVVVSGGNLTVYEAGLYNCTATNDFASTYIVVEVVLEVDYLPHIAGFVAVTVVVISVIFIFIYSIYYKNTKMRRYSLKNPKLNTQNGNVAHNGWDMQLPMTKLS